MTAARRMGWRTRRALGGLAAGVAGGGLAAALAACAGPQGGGEAPGAASAGPVTVRIQGRTGSEEEVYGQRIPAFEAAHPGIKVESELSPEWGAPKTATLAAAGALGDLGQMFVNTQDYHNFFLQGVLVAVDDYVRRDKFDLKQYYQDAVNSLVVDGKTGGLPFHGYMARIAVMYNTEIFKQAGLPPPGPEWTYDDLATLLPKLAKYEGSEVAQWGLSMTWAELTTMISVFRAWGGDVFSPDGKRSVLTAPAVAAALRWHVDRFLRDRTLALPATGVNVQNLFTGGKAALWGRNNPGAVGTLIPLRGQLSWGMTLMPRGPGGRRGGMLQSSALSLTRDSRQRDAAWQLQKWMTDRETGVLWALASKGSLTPGARPDVYRDPRFLGRPDLPPGVQDVARRAMDEPEPFNLAWNFRGVEIDKVLSEGMNKLLRGESAPEAGFLQDLQTRIQAILDQPRPGNA